MTTQIISEQVVNADEKVRDFTISEQVLPSPPSSTSSSQGEVSQSLVEVAPDSVAVSEPVAEVTPEVTFETTPEPATQPHVEPQTPANNTQSEPAVAASAIPSRQIPPYPKSSLTLVDRFIDEPRSLRVAVIGGGLAGILAGILLPAKVPNIKLNIYEKNSDFVSAPISPLLFHSVLTDPGRHMAGECVPRSAVRHSVARVPVHV